MLPGSNIRQDCDYAGEWAPYEIKATVIPFPHAWYGSMIMPISFRPGWMEADENRILHQRRLNWPLGVMSRAEWWRQHCWVVVMHAGFVGIHRWQPQISGVDIGNLEAQWLTLPAHSNEPLSFHSAVCSRIGSYNSRLVFVSNCHEATMKNWRGILSSLME